MQNTTVYKELGMDEDVSHIGQDEATSWVPLDILLISTAENFGSFIITIFY